MRLVRLILPLLLLALASGCVIIRNPANYRASIDLWHDASVAQIQLLEAEVERLRAAGETAECKQVADTLVFVKYWASHQRALDLAAAELGEKPESAPTDVPTPADLCRSVPAPVISPAPIGG